MRPLRYLAVDIRAAAVTAQLIAGTFLAEAPATAAPDPASDAGRPIEIAVRLRDYRIDLDPVAAAPAGTVRFTVRNEGHRTHALRVVAPGIAARTDELPPGGEATLEVAFAAPGVHTLLCDVAYHDVKGMVSPFTVTEGPAGAD